MSRPTENATVLSLLGEDPGPRVDLDGEGLLRETARDTAYEIDRYDREIQTCAIRQTENFRRVLNDVAAGNGVGIGSISGSSHDGLWRAIAARDALRDVLRYQISAIREEDASNLS